MTWRAIVARPHTSAVEMIRKRAAAAASASAAAAGIDLTPSGAGGPGVPGYYYRPGHLMDNQHSGA